MDTVEMPMELGMFLHRLEEEEAFMLSLPRNNILGKPLLWSFACTSEDISDRNKRATTSELILRETKRQGIKVSEKIIATVQEFPDLDNVYVLKVYQWKK